MPFFKLPTFALLVLGPERTLSELPPVLMTPRPIAPVVSSVGVGVGEGTVEDVL